jgi:hypothetical protein
MVLLASPDCIMSPITSTGHLQTSFFEPSGLFFLEAALIASHAALLCSQLAHPATCSNPQPPPVHTSRNCSAFLQLWPLLLRAVITPCIVTGGCQLCPHSR